MLHLCERSGSDGPQTQQLFLREPLAAGAAALSFAVDAIAQNWLARPIKLIMPTVDSCQ
jgi:hypothetical protein